jgi:type I pantothenate kinase
MPHDVCVVDPMLRTVLDEIRNRQTQMMTEQNRRLVVGLAGAVSVGKTTFAAALAEEFSQRYGNRCVVVGTDGFLLPNAVLVPRGRQFHKGFPDTYDTGALQAFLTTAASATTQTVIPTYSHEAFDTVGTRIVDLEEILLVEGINILDDAYAPLLDFRIYLDADEPVVIDWFVTRFLRLIMEAETDPTSFYVRFVPLDMQERADTARDVWDSINGPNLHAHIAPTKGNADLVLRLRPDHTVDTVTAG